MDKPEERPVPDGYKVVYRRSFVHPRTKRRVYAKSGKSFRFIVRA
jgi:hypothetical protein